MLIFLEWTTFKARVIDKPNLKYLDRGDFYYLEYEKFESSIMKDNGDDQTDFETNFQPLANNNVTKTEMVLSQEVAASTTQSVLVTPDSGPFIIRTFEAQAAFHVNCVVRLNWDAEGDNIPIWTIKGNGSMPFIKELTGDGVKKLELSLENSLTTGPVYLSGYVLIEQGS